jgi:hypothetical protein
MQFTALDGYAIEAVSSFCDWLDPDRVRLRDEKRRYYQIENVCKLSESPETIARSFVAMVDNGLWTIEQMCEMLTLVPAEKYTAIVNAIEILKERRIDTRLLKAHKG